MKTTANKRKTTTLSCDESTREFIAAEAKRTGKLQRQVLADIVSAYRLQQKRSATKGAKPETSEVPGSFDFATLEKKLSSVITKDVNRVIGFIQKQEEIYLKPILKQVKDNGTLAQQQINELKEFNNPTDF
ncbi:MAG: hypothetical protein IJQ93_10610 [Bacteroidales bacterium]|nr:hypothetical protein [Bacteroidales bacterium]